MRTHELKLETKFCDAVLSGVKSFEVRRNDRGYEVGDKIIFQPIDSSHGPVSEFEHPIAQSIFEITYILCDWGIKESFVVLAIKEAS